jgi:hypothetical protein
MVKVLGPGNIAITAPSVASPVRSSATSFGAPQAEALGDLGKGLEAVGGAIGRYKDEHQEGVDQAFLDQYDLESDLTYGRSADEEQVASPAGADGLTDRVRQRFEGEADGVLERVRSKGFAPSDKALAKAESIKLRRQHQYLRQSGVYEINERVRNFGTQLDDTLQNVAQRGAATGDIDSALTRAEQSIESYRGVIPAGGLDAAREKAAKYFFDQVKATADPDVLEDMTRRLLQGGKEQADPAEGAAAAAGRAGGDNVTAKPSARNDAIGRAASAEGVDEATLRTFARIESGNDPRARTGSYKGLFQLSDSEFAKHGGGDIFNADDNAAAAARKLKAEAGRFAQKHGRAPSTLDLYLVHQQGEAGYDAHLNRPGAPAWQNMAGTGEGRQKGAAWAKKAIWGNIPDDMKRQFGSVENVTSADFVDVWRQKVERLGGGGGAVAEAPANIRGALAREVATRLPEIQELIEKRREQIELRARASAIISGQEPVDPGSKADRDTMDKVIKATDIPERLGNADPQAAGQVTALVKATGYVPEPAVSQLRASAVNGTPEQKTFALETAANILREKPGALEGSEGARSLKDDAQLYQTLTLDAGLSGQEALGRLAELRTPEFAKRREAFKKEQGEILKSITPDEIVSEYDGWFSSAPELGGSPGQRAVVFDAYRDLVGYHYVKTGDVEIAKSMAKKDMQRTYSVSEMTGNRRLMRHPPEFYYPRIEPRGGEEPDHSYFTDQLKAEVNNYVRGAFAAANPEVRGQAVAARGAGAPPPEDGPEIPIEDIFIEPIPQTNADVRSGRLPGYAVVWKEMRDGIPVMNTAPGMVFRADVKSEMARQSRNREERVRYLRRSEEERLAKREDMSRTARKLLGFSFEGLGREAGEAAARRLNQPNLINEPE